MAGLFFPTAFLVLCFCGRVLPTCGECCSTFPMKQIGARHMPLLAVLVRSGGQMPEKVVLSTLPSACPSGFPWRGKDQSISLYILYKIATHSHHNNRNKKSSRRSSSSSSGGGGGGGGGGGDQQQQQQQQQQQNNNKTIAIIIIMIIVILLVCLQGLTVRGG